MSQQNLKAVLDIIVCVANWVCSPCVSLHVSHHKYQQPTATVRSTLPWPSTEADGCEVKEMFQYNLSRMVHQACLRKYFLQTQSCPNIFHTRAHEKHMFQSFKSFTTKCTLLAGLWCVYRSKVAWQGIEPCKECQTKCLTFAGQLNFHTFSQIWLVQIDPKPYALFCYQTGSSILHSMPNALKKTPFFEGLHAIKSDKSCVGRQIDNIRRVSTAQKVCQISCPSQCHVTGSIRSDTFKSNWFVRMWSLSLMAGEESMHRPRY